MRRAGPTSGGFTLIELSIALAIAAMLMVTAVAGVNALTDANLRSASVEITGAIKYNYDRAIMEKRNQRLVFDIDQNLWWAEFSTDAYALDGELQEEAPKSTDEDDRKREAEADEDDPFFDSDEDPEVTRALEGGNAVRFQPDTDQGPPRPLPSDIHFSRILTGHQAKAFTRGVAYLHFFRAGWTEPARIELTDGDEYRTLVVMPLTGRTRSYAERFEDEAWENEAIDKSGEAER